MNTIDFDSDISMIVPVDPFYPLKEIIFTKQWL